MTLDRRHVPAPDTRPPPPCAHPGRETVETQLRWSACALSKRFPPQKKQAAQSQQQQSQQQQAGGEGGDGGGDGGDDGASSWPWPWPWSPYSSAAGARYAPLALRKPA